MNKKEKKRRINLFTKQIYFWQKKLGFTDVQIYVGCRTRKSCKAQWCSCVEAQQISVFYSPLWLFYKDTSDEEINRVAFHEVYESQLYDLHDMLEEHFAHKYIQKKVHSLVRRAEQFIYPELKGKP